MMESSRDQGNRKAVGEAYFSKMAYAYTEGLWGKDVRGNLREQLRGNQAVIHSRSTNLYGVLDNDDTYQFAGGLSAATTAAGGAEPKMFISNVRKGGDERMEEMKQFLTREMRSRLWNPKWIEGMQKSGYSGARQMAREVEHLYGLRATAPSQVDASVWQETFDVYVSDKHKLGMEAYFSKQNPHARQMLSARLLEVDRQGVYRFSDADRKALVRAYVESVNRDGVSCYANACDNRKLVSYVTAQAGAAVSNEAAAQWQERMRQALTTPRDAAPVQSAVNKLSAPVRRAATLQEMFPNMRIFEVSEGRLRVAGREVGWGWLLVALASLVAGACLSFAQRRMDGSVISLMAGRGGNG